MLTVLLEYNNMNSFIQAYWYLDLCDCVSVSLSLCVFAHVSSPTHRPIIMVDMILASDW